MEESLLLRQIPHSVEAEQSVLGAMLIDARCIPDVIEALHPEDFYLKTNREIYETIYAMFNFSATIDPVTVLDQMKQRGVYDENTSRNYLLQLMEITPTAANVKEYVRHRQGQGPPPPHCRRPPGNSPPWSRRGQRPARPCWIWRSSGSMPSAKAGPPRGWNPWPRSWWMCLTASRSWPCPTATSPAWPRGSGTWTAPSPAFTRELILLAARPGMGKTSFALNVLLHAGKFSGKSVVFFSLEMSREQLATRLISSEAFLDNKKLMTGKLSPDDWDKVTLASAALAHTKIFIDDNPSLSVADMNAKCRRVEDLGMVVIDYLQLMQSSGSGTKYAGENRQQVVADISRALKIMAKELHVPVLCLSQLSRANESRSDKRPMLSDLRESGAIEQDADVVMFLYRDDYYNKDSDKRNQAECIIAKNRRGETTTIPLQWLPEFTAFSSLERNYEEPD